MKTILLLHDESGSPKPRLQNVAGSKVTQRPSEGTPGCSCDRWGHPSPDCVEHNVQVQLKLSFSSSVPQPTEWQRIEIRSTPRLSLRGGELRRRAFSFSGNR
jgi:hypothetical protein